MTKAQEKQIQMLEEQNKELLRGSKAGRTAMSAMKKIILEQKEENEKLKNNVIILVDLSEELKKSMDKDGENLKKLQKKIKDDKWISDNNSKEYKKIIASRDRRIQRLEDELKAYSKATTHNGQMALAGKAREEKLQGFYDIKKKKLSKSQKKCFNLEKEIKDLKERLSLKERISEEDTDTIRQLKKANSQDKCSRCSVWVKKDPCSEKQIKDLKRLVAILNERLSLRQDPLSEKLETLLRSAGS